MQSTKLLTEYDDFTALGFSGTLKYLFNSWLLPLRIWNIFGLSSNIATPSVAALPKHYFDPSAKT